MTESGTGGYLFAYFTTHEESDGEQVRLARSDGDDPLRWHPLNGGTPVLCSDVGARGVRDPFLLRAAGLPDETAHFYLIATDLRMHGQVPSPGWLEVQRHGSRNIVVWESDDLVSWSPPRLVEVAPPCAGNAWAPEATFDPTAGSYLVYWASTLYPPGVARESVHSYNRMLAASTRDFHAFSKPFTWIDRGWSVIDSTVATAGNGFYRFSKDERSADSSTPQAKHLTLERSPAAGLSSTEWEFVADGIGAGSRTGGVAHGEGPIIIWAKSQRLWYLFVDEFGLRRYLPFSSPTLATDTWQLCDDYNLPPGASHGSILRISAAEWSALASLTGP
jgi:hypothetical protein